MNRQLQVLKEIADVCEALLDGDDLERVLRRLVDVAQRCADVERVLFIWDNNQQGELKVVPDSPEGRHLVQTIPLAQLAAPRNTPSIGDEIRKALKVQSVVSYPLMLDGELCGTMLIGTSTTPLGGEDAELFRLFALQADLGIQITRMHNKIERIQNQLLRSAERLTLAQMAPAVAHELSNYLTVVWGRTQLLLPRIKSKDIAGALETLAIISEYLEKMKKFTAGLMNIYAFNRQGIDKSHLDVNQIIMDLVEFIKPQTKYRNIEFSLKLDKDLPLIVANGDRIQGILLNLYANAAEAMRKGRIITKTEYNPEHGEVRITVADNGPGIPEHIQDKIFSPGFTTKKDGHGLGLSFCRHLVEAQGGRIILNSRPGQGAAFTIILPVGSAEW